MLRGHWGSFNRLLRGEGYGDGRKGRKGGDSNIGVGGIAASSVPTRQRRIQEIGGDSM